MKRPPEALRGPVRPDLAWPVITPSPSSRMDTGGSRALLRHKSGIYETVSGRYTRANEVERT